MMILEYKCKSYETHDQNLNFLVNQEDRNYKEQTVLSISTAVFLSPAQTRKIVVEET